MPQQTWEFWCFNVAGKRLILRFLSGILDTFAVLIRMATSVAGGHSLSSKLDITAVNFSDYADCGVQEILETFPYLKFKDKEYPIR